MSARGNSSVCICLLLATGFHAISVFAQPVALRSLDDFIQSSNSFQISHVTVFDGEKLIENATVIVKGGWIDKVCADSNSPCSAADLPAINGKGEFLMPSLIDSEGHFTRPAEMLGQLLNREEPICGDKPENKGQTLSA